MSKARTRAAEVTAESALVEAREAAIRADTERRMNDFLSHEIRNPLSVAAMAAEFIALNNDVPAAMQNDLGIVASNLQFVEELLTSSLSRLKKYLTCAAKTDAQSTFRDLFCALHCTMQAAAAAVNRRRQNRRRIKKKAMAVQRSAVFTS